MNKRLDDRQFAALAVEARRLREQERRMAVDLEKLRQQLADAQRRLDDQAVLSTQVRG